MIPITPAFVGGFGPVEMGIVLLLAVLLFGANKLPKLARSMGEATGEFQKGREQVDAELAAMRAGTADAAREPDAESDTA